MSDPVDVEAIRERAERGREFLGDWRQNANASKARAFVAAVLDDNEALLADRAALIEALDLVDTPYPIDVFPERVELPPL